MYEWIRMKQYGWLQLSQRDKWQWAYFSYRSHLMKNAMPDFPPLDSFSGLLHEFIFYRILQSAMKKNHEFRQLTTGGGTLILWNSLRKNCEFCQLIVEKKNHEINQSWIFSIGAGFLFYTDKKNFINGFLPSSSSMIKKFDCNYHNFIQQSFNEIHDYFL